MTDHPPPENPAPATMIGSRDFDNPMHTSVMDEHVDAFNLIFNLLNSYRNEQKLINASNRDRPAIEGITDDIHIEGNIVASFNGPDGYQFRRTFGHVVCKKMQQLGWQPLRSARCRPNPYFKNSTIYGPIDYTGNL